MHVGASGASAETVVPTNRSVLRFLMFFICFLYSSFFVPVRIAPKSMAPIIENQWKSWKNKLFDGFARLHLVLPLWFFFLRTKISGSTQFSGFMFSLLIDMHIRKIDKWKCVEVRFSWYYWRWAGFQNRVAHTLTPWDIFCLDLLAFWTTNHRKSLIFHFCHCLAMKSFESQNWNWKKIKYAGNSSRWDLFKNAIVFFEKRHFKKVFRIRISGFSEFSVLAMWAALLE